MPFGKIVGHKEQYRVEEIIAKGAFSFVYRCTDLSTGKQYAIKIINRDLAEKNHMTEALIREVNAMELVGNTPNVVTLVDKLVSKHNFYIIMDLAEGGTLLDMIRDKRRGTSRDWVQGYFKQLLYGLASIHERNVAHRDLKPENILFNTNKTRLMISDFGFACYAPENHFLHRGCGTLKYCAPELLHETPRYQGQSVDIWAAGVTLYVMLFNTHPFPCKPLDVDSLLERMEAQPLLIYPREPEPEIQDFLSRMLAVDPGERWTARQLLEHPWMTQTIAKGPWNAEDSSWAAPDISLASETENSLVSGSSYDEVDDGFYHGSHLDIASGESFDEECEESGVYYNSTTPLSAATTAQHQPQYSDQDVINISSSNDLSPSVTSVESSYRASLLNGGGGSNGDGGDSVLVYIRGWLLTAKIVVNFMVFCGVLFFVTLLRLLFDIDVADLPLPRRVCALISYLVIPPAERGTRSHQQQQQQGSSRRAAARSAANGGGGGGQQPVPKAPGFRIRRYVRKAEKLIVTNSGNFLPSPPAPDAAESIPRAAADTNNNTAAAAAAAARELKGDAASPIMAGSSGNIIGVMTSPLLTDMNTPDAAGLHSSTLRFRASRARLGTAASSASDLAGGRHMLDASSTEITPLSEVLLGSSSRSDNNNNNNENNSGNYHNATYSMEEVTQVFSPSVPLRRFPGQKKRIEDFPSLECVLEKE